MKIIGIRNVNGRELPPQVLLMADSSVIRTNKPFFVPHFAKEFTGHAAIAMHIGRLGKHIAPRFANRYCDAIAPAITVKAHSIDLPQQQETFSALSHSFDGALLLGDFTKIDPAVSINDSTVALTINSETFDAKNLSNQGVDYRKVIANLSVYFTLKMGDIIVIELSDSEMPLTPGDNATSTLNGTKLLTIRIK